MAGIRIAARSSPLSRAQVAEFIQGYGHFFSEGFAEPLLVETYGDRDLFISLRSPGYSDLFTKEVDQLVIDGAADLAIHSAKDCPEILDPALELYLRTPSIHPLDALVMKEGFTLKTLPHRCTILASSAHREENILRLRPDAIVRDVRGTIEQRLSYLRDQEIDGVVIAEAALIRLKLTHLNRLLMMSQAHPLQGQLALIGRKDNTALKRIFLKIEKTFASWHPTA